MTFVEWLELGATATAYAESDALLPGWIALAGLMLAVSIGMGRGKLWAVRLFRWPSSGAIVRYLPILAAGVLLDAGSAPIDSGLAWAILGFAVVKLPCLFIVYRALKQVRWLDPASLPHEWEPSARRGA